MVIKIGWSDEANKTYDNNIEYLLHAWSEREIKKFILKTEEVLLKIQKYPEAYPLSKKNRKVRKIKINKYITLYYRFYSSKREIVLLSFWNTKQDPLKLKY